MIHLDLFSGIGGFSLAADWVWGKDHHIHSFVEIDPFCQKILKKHWPGVPIHGDIKTYKHDKTPVDLITGGFPCQPFSCAGKRKGKADDRYLWPEMFRVISEFKPTWIIGENVVGIINMGFNKMLTDLERLQYEVQPIIIPACAIDAIHRRDRVWIIAHSSSNRRKCGENSQGSRLEGEIAKDSKQPRDRWTSKTGGMFKEFITNSKCLSLDSTILPENGQKLGWESSIWCENRKFPELATGISTGLERWSTMGESPLIRINDGIPDVLDRLKSLGNAIVPQVVYPIMQAIKEIEEGTP